MFKMLNYSMLSDTRPIHVQPILTDFTQLVFFLLTVDTNDKIVIVYNFNCFLKILGKIVPNYGRQHFLKIKYL